MANIEKATFDDWEDSDIWPAKALGNDAPHCTERLRVQLDEGAYPPTRAHLTDAGLDLFSRENVVLLPGEMYSFNTGVHVEIPPHHFGKVEGKSGLSVNFSILSFGGVIDEGYAGDIRVKLYNVGRRTYHFVPGEAIAQLVIMPCVYPGVELVDEVAGKERGSDGFGSTAGRQKP